MCGVGSLLSYPTEWGSIRPGPSEKLRKISQDCLSVEGFPKWYLLLLMYNKSIIYRLKNFIHKGRLFIKYRFRRENITWFLKIEIPWLCFFLIWNHIFNIIFPRAIFSSTFGRKQSVSFKFFLKAENNIFYSLLSNLASISYKCSVVQQNISLVV